MRKRNDLLGKGTSVMIARKKLWTTFFATVSVLVCSAAMAAKPEEAAKHAKLAEDLEKTESYKLAIKEYGWAIWYDSKNYKYYIDRARCYQELAMIERKKYSSKKKGHARAYNLYMAPALRDVDKAVSLKPDYAENPSLRAFYSFLAANDQAISGNFLSSWLITSPIIDCGIVHATRAIQLEPDEGSHYVHRALLFRMKKNWRGLYDDAIRIIELKPFKWETWVKTCAFENPFPPEHKELQDKIKEALLAEGGNLNEKTPSAVEPNP